MRRRWGVSWCVLLLSAAGCRPPAEQALREDTQAFRSGDLDRALREAGRARQRPDLLLLRSEILLARNDVTAALDILHSKLPADLGPLEPRRRMLEGYALSKQGRYSEAESRLSAACEMARAGRAADVLIAAQLLRGQICFRQYRPEAAEPFLKEALDTAIRTGDSYQQAAALLNLGFIPMKEMRWDEALSLFEQAAVQADRAGAQLVQSAVLANLSLCYAQLGDLDRAADARRRSLEVQRRAGARLFVVQGLGEMGNIFLLRNEPVEAARWFRQAIDLAREIQAPDEESSWLSTLAAALVQNGRWAEAEPVNREAQSLKQHTGDARGLLYVMLNTAEIAAGQSRDREAGRIYENVIAAASGDPPLEWSAHAGLARLESRLGRSAEASRHFEAALGWIERTRAELIRTEYKITFLTSLIRFYRDYVSHLLRSGEEGKALAVADSSRARLLARAPEPGTPSRAPSAGELIRQARAAGDAVLVYWLAPGESELWAITRGTFRRVAIPGEERIGPLVESHRNLIEVSLRNPIESASAAASELYQMLVRPVEDLVPRGSNVVIVPDGALHGLNFETLLAGGSRPHYWIEDVTVSVAPSLGALAVSAAGRRTGQVLLLGDPPAAGDAFARLPHALAEIEAIRKRFPAEQVNVHTGRDATPDAYFASHPESVSYIHFAAHAEANREAPLESAVILSPGARGFKLYARDVASVPLRARLVTISACRSAGAKIYSGEGLVGFAWAFLRAGADNVIAGLWDVSDRSTADLMARLYGGVAAGEVPAEALRQAKLALAGSPGNYRKPYYWAAFQLYTRTPAGRRKKLSQSAGPGQMSQKPPLAVSPGRPKSPCRASRSGASGRPVKRSATFPH